MKIFLHASFIFLFKPLNTDEVIDGGGRTHYDHMVTPKGCQEVGLSLAYSNNLLLDARENMSKGGARGDDPLRKWNDNLELGMGRWEETDPKKMNKEEVMKQKVKFLVDKNKSRYCTTGSLSSPTSEYSRSCIIWRKYWCC